MMAELALAGAGAIAAGFFLSDIILKEATVEEMRILMRTTDTATMLERGWGAEEFPAFFKARWKDNDRGFYVSLMRKMKGKGYGEGRRLLRSLLRIEDGRQRGKGSPEGGDAEYISRFRAVIERYKEKEGFAGFLAAFIEKRHMERVTDGAGG